MIKFFVSSTFNDMHYERDIMQTIIMASINSYAASRGEKIRFSDLRWGVNTLGLDEIDASKKIIKKCADEIESCDPYMIVILGDRFGTVMDSALMEECAKKYELTDVNDISVTMLEIMIGSKVIGIDKMLFYFRNIEGDNLDNNFCECDEENRKRLCALKQKIIEMNGNVKEYNVRWCNDKKCFDNMDGFKQILLDDLKTIIDKKNEDIDINKQELFVKNIAFESYISDNLYSIISKSIMGHRFVALFGNEGTGKTCTAACLFEKLCAEKEYLVIPCFFDFFSEDNIELTDAFIQKVLSEYFDAYANASPKEVCFIIDGIGFLSHREQRAIIELLRQHLENDCQNIRIFVTISKFITCDDIETISLTNELSREDIVAVINKVLSGKEMSQRVVDALCEKCNGKNYLYEKTLLQRLEMMALTDYQYIQELVEYNSLSCMEAIEKRQVDIINDVTDSFTDFLFDFCLEFATYYNPIIIENALWLISNSIYGFSVDDLMAILRCEPERDGIIIYFGSICKDIFAVKSDSKIDFRLNELKTFFQFKLNERIEDKELIVCDVCEYLNKERKENSSEFFLWLMRANYCGHETIDTMLNLSDYSFQRVISLLDGQNIYFDEEESKRPQFSCESWGSIISGSCNKSTIDNSNIKRIIDKLYLLINSENTYRLTNVDLVFEKLQSIVEEKISVEKYKEQIFGINYEAHWNSILREILKVRIEVKSHLNVNTDELRDYYFRISESVSGYYQNDIRTIINEALLLCEKDVVIDEEYNKVCEHTKRLKNNEGCDNDEKKAIFHIFDIVGKYSVQRKNYKRAMEFYNEAFGILVTIQDIDQFLLHKELGYLYYKIALCMNELNERKSCINKFLINAEKWLTQAIKECYDDEEAGGLERVLMIIKNLK